MRKIFAHFLLLATLLFCFVHKNKASHAVGIDIYYECLGGNQYQFFVNLYRDCDGIAAPSSVTINLNSASCGINSSTTLPLVSSQNASQICAAQINNTSCDGGSLPGIEQYVYSGTFTLPQQCSDWVVSYSLCCRNGGITNLQSPSSQNLYVQATIDNTGTNCNNSPQFSALPTPYLCVGQPFSFNNGAVDPDGNTLVYTLINPMSAAGTNIPYTGGYNPNNPLAVSGAFNFDPVTGQMQFTPSQVQQGVITVLVEEYDSNGVLVGTTMRDIQVVVINCSNTPPTGSGVNGSTSIYNYDICSGSSFCFDINTDDADANTTSVSWNSGIPGGTFTTSGAPFQTGTFCWTPTANDIGTHYFTVTVEDDACPIPGLNTYIFEVNVNPSPDPPVDAGPDQDICLGETTSLNATTAGAGAVYSWSPSTGLSCTSCQSPDVTVTTNQIYTVTATFPSGCSQTDEVAINVAPTPNVNVFPTNISICSGSSANLTANSATATGYSWSPGGMTGATVNVSPATTTTYTVTASNSFGCTDDATSTVTVSPPPPTEICNNIYVTTTGGGTGDGPSDPTDLASALLMSQCNNATIKLATGTYNIDNPIVDILGYTTLEGGYDAGNGWVKTSTPGATTIFRSTANPEGAVDEQRLVAIYMNSASNFRFQDLTIEVADAPATGQEGMSTYGIHMNNCSDYDIVRCQIIAGNASAGTNGVTAGGTGGGAAGGNGGNGGNRNSGCDADGQNGTGGGNGSGGANGGNGGGGANGDGCNIFGCNADPENGSNGTNGASGANGTSAPGAAPGTNPITGVFFEPNGQSLSGTDGQSGAGGGGGGGMSRGSDCTCSYFGTGNGGNGGNGGNAGLGGTGGYGGGGAFSIFLVNNQANGNFTDVVIGAPTEGNGGTAGLGQNGTGGAGGGASQNAGCGGSNANSGAGGSGGNGGNGGNGQPGADGLAGKVYLNGSAPTLTQGGSNVPVATGISSPTDFNLAAQPTINAENISCTNTDIDYSGPASNTWNYGSASTPATGTGANTTTQYTGLGRKDIVYGTDTYTGFINITLDGVTDPDINSTAYEMAPDTFVVCVGSPADFYTTASNFVEFFWDFGGAITPNTYSDMNLPNLTFNTVGTFTVTLQGRTDCCGLSNITEVVLIVDDIPTIAVAGVMDFCEGDFTTLTATSNGDSLVWSPNYGINVDTGTVVTFNPPVTTDYILTAFSFYGLCSATENFTVTVNENPDISTVVTDITCGDDGTITASAANITNPLNFQWNDPASQTTGTASNLFAGNYQVIVSDAVTGCVDTSYANVGAGTSPFVYISNSINVSCYLGSDGEATAAVANGTGPFDFDWTDLTTGGNLLLENDVTTSTLTGLSAGDYNVFITDALGCTHTIDFSIGQPDTSVYVIDSIIVDATCYATNDGSIVIQADGGSGGFTYLWDANAGGSTIDSVGGLNPGDYDVIITDMNGCTTTETFTVDGPTVELFTDAGLPDTLCGGTYTLQAIPTAGINTGEWLPALTTGPGTATFSSTTDPNATVDIGTDYGSYTFFWMEDNNQGCTDTASVEIEFLIPPVVDAGLDDTICGSFDYILQGTSILPTNTWSLIAGPGTVTFVDDSSPTTSLTVDQVGVYEIELLGLNSFNCEARDTLLLNFSSPSFTATIVDDECSALIGSIDVDNVTGSFGTLTYSNDNGINYQPTSLFSNLGEADYDVIIMDDFGCTDTNTLSVGNNGTLTFNDTTITDPTCFSFTDGTITIDAVSTALPLSFNIDGGVGQASNVFTGLGDGTYSVVVVDMNACTDTVLVTLAHPDSITFDTTSVAPLCFGDCNGEIVFSNAAGGNNLFTYSIDNGVTSQATTTFSNLCDGSYDLVVEDGNGCQSNMTLVLTEPNALTLNITIDSASCNGTADGLVTATVNGGTPTYDYNWNGIALNNQFQATDVAAGIYDLTITDGNGCTIDTLAYEVGEPIAVAVGTINSIPPSCYGGQDGTLTVTSGANVVAYSLDGVNFQASNQFTNLISGTYTVHVQDANGCTNSALHTINSYDEVTADATTSNPTICVGQLADLIGTGTGGVGTLDYDWTPAVGNGANQIVSPVITTTYELTVTDENGCSATDFVTITVNTPITVTAFESVTICPGGTASISSFATGGDGGGNPLNYTYVWDNGFTGMNQDVSPAATTTYAVYATDGCGSESDTAYVTITVSTPPVVDFTLSNNSGCLPVTVTFTDINGGTGATCLWNFGDGYTSTDCGDVTHTYEQPGIYDVSYTVTNADGCSTTLSYEDSVEVYGYPVADFSFSPEVGSIIENEITFANQSIDATEYLWIFGDSVTPTMSALEHPTATYPDFTGGTYEACLIAITENGCTDTTCQMITIEDQLLFYVPNTFTPNADGVNDEFLPSALGIDTDGYRLLVFNRWGQLIFETSDINNGWDGTFNGEHCQQDAYVWKIELQNTAEFNLIRKYTGHVNLLR